MLAALREIARVVLRSLCRLARVSLGAIAASGWKFFPACACPLRLRSQRQDACSKRARLLRGLADVLELFVAGSCGL